VLGFIVASLIFTGGNVIGLSGIQMMGVFYGVVVLLTVATGLFKSWKRKPVGMTSLPDSA
jgi:ferrous iron transport protein B